MGNTVEFILKLRDLMSGGFQKAGSTAQTAMRTVDAAVARTARNMSTTRQSVEGLNKKLDDLRRTRDTSVRYRDIITANREAERLERRIDRLNNMGRRGNSGGAPMLGGLTGYIGAAAVAAGAGKIINAGFEAQAQQASFKVLAGDQMGGKLYKDLTGFAQDSIFGNEVYKNAQTMLAFGQAADKVMPRMKMLGDISMGNKQRFEALTLAFSQMQATGRLMGQDLLQFVNAGFNPLQELSVMTGISLGKLKKKMEDGAISADMVTRAFEHATSQGGKFYNMTEKIAATDFGKWEAFKGQISGLAMQFGGALAPAAGRFIKEYLEPAATWISKHQDLVFKLTGGLIAVAAGLKVWAFWQAAVNVAVSANPVVLLVASLGALALAMDTIFGKTEPAAINAIKNDTIKAAYAAAGGQNAEAYAGSFTTAMGSESMLQRFTQLGQMQGAAMADGAQSRLSALINNWSPIWGNLLNGGNKVYYYNGKPYFSMESIDKQIEMEQLSAKHKDIGSMPGSKFIPNSFRSKFFDPNPKAAQPAGASGDMSGLTNSESKIHGGGPKVITFNFYAPVVKDTTITAGSADEAFKHFDDKIAEGVQRVLGGAGADIH